MSIPDLSHEYAAFLEGSKNIKERVYEGQYRAARTVNTELIPLYHPIGTKITRNQKKFGGGTKGIDQLRKDLRNEFPDIKGFSLTTLQSMKIFAERSPISEIRQQAADQLSWIHFVTILTEVKAKEFFEDNCFGRVCLYEVSADFNIFQTLFEKLIWRPLKLLSFWKHETARFVSSFLSAFLIGCVQEALAHLLRYSSNLPLLGNNVKGEKQGNFSSKVLETYWGILLLPLTALSVQMKPLQSKNLFVKERNTHP